MKLGKIKKEIVAIILAEISPKSIFIFGSRATGEAKKRSDIDIGIIAEKKLTAVEFANIEERIAKISTLLTIELVDFTKRNDTFSKEALKKIELLYGTIDD